MNPSKNSTAIKLVANQMPANQTLANKVLRTLAWLGLLSVLLTGAEAFAAQVAGTVINLSGPLLARKADGTVKILSQKSEVEQGDTLVSEKATYARIKFIDNSEITLRPNSQLRIDSFSYDEAKPENDSAIFNLIKGGLRSITGLLGKRSKERVGLNTPTATIGIRGTTYIVQYVAPGDNTPSEGEPALSQSDFALASVAALAPDTAAPPHSDAPASATAIVPVLLAQNGRNVPPAPGAGGTLAPGLYVHVIDGIINLSNKGGSQSFTAGQFGFTASLVQPPVVVPVNPGIQFSPPPAFSSSTAPKTAANGGDKPKTVDCEVR
jgi:hypothetical protein